MQEKTCNLWIEAADFRCIPTSGALLPDGTAQMDAGIAKEAAQRHSGVELDLGRLIASRGNHVHLIKPGLVSFPYKQFAWSAPSLDIIRRSARQLITVVGTATTLLPRPGCGPGELAWETVKEALSTLPDNVIVIEHV